MSELDTIKLARRLLIRHIKECVSPHLHASGFVDGRDRKNRSLLGMFTASPLQLTVMRPVSLSSIDAKVSVIGATWVSDDNENGGISIVPFEDLMIDDLTIIALHVSDKTVFAKHKRR